MFFFTAIYLYIEGTFRINISLKVEQAKQVIMIIQQNIFRKVISAATITALMTVYTLQDIRFFCSVNEGKNMSCCKSDAGSVNSCAPQDSKNLSIRSVNKCPCPSMESGLDKSFDEILPNAGKAETKSQFTEFTSSPVAAYVGPISVLISTVYEHSYLSSKERLSLLQSFLI